MNHNTAAKRAAPAPRRLLGEARREATESAHIAASKRRRLAAATDADDENDDDMTPSGPIASGALGDDDAAVFADAVYEKDDHEADNIYEQVDQRMQSRRQRQRELGLEKQLAQYREENPTVRQQFADLKSGLHGVSQDEWAAIPDIGDYSVKKQRFQKFTPLPDSLLERARQENASVAVEPSNAGASTDLAAIGAGRTSVLEHNLDVAGERAHKGQTVDQDGYLSAMTGASISTDTEIGDVKKARLLLKSVTTANATHAPGWIASARLEEKVGKLSTARKVILMGCKKCIKDDEVWIEAARLHPTAMARRLLAQAVRHIPKSLKVWMQAAELETNMDAKRRVLRKALEIIPQSACVWQAAVELEEPAGARILLSRAVECAPGAVGLWLALAKLEPYAEAKVVLKRAREAIRNDESIWVTEAQLEEANCGAESDNVNNVIAKAVVVMGDGDGSITKDKWMEQAEVMDQAEYVGTVAAIVRNVIGMNVIEDNRESSWLGEAKQYEEKKCMEVARAIHRHLSVTFPKQVTVWREYVEFERRQDMLYKMEEVLNEAVEHCGDADILWLMLAKDAWKRKGVGAARRVLDRAFAKLPEAESIWLAAAKVETESGDLERARQLLERARMHAPSAKVFMKSALLERQAGMRDGEKQFLVRGLEGFPDGSKLWLMLAQWFERGAASNGHGARSDAMDAVKDGADSKSAVGLLWNARDAYSMAVERCRKCAALWVGYSRLEERGGQLAKARAILERGREHCAGAGERDGDGDGNGVAGVDVLWCESVWLEMRASQARVARAVVARALRERVGSGALWCASVRVEDRRGQKARSVDAIRACGEDGGVVLEVGKFIWRSGKTDKARAWLRRSVECGRSFGDAWATWLKFEIGHADADADANAQRCQDVERDAVKAEPRYGELWTSVSKKVGNEALTCLQILRLVAAKVTKESNVTGLYD